MGVQPLTNNNAKTSFGENPSSRCWAVASKEKKQNGHYNIRCHLRLHAASKRRLTNLSSVVIDGERQRLWLGHWKLYGGNVLLKFFCNVHKRRPALLRLIGLLLLPPTRLSFTTRPTLYISSITFITDDTILRYDIVYLTCSKKLKCSQLSPPHGTNRKIKEKNELKINREAW